MIEIAKVSGFKNPEADLTYFENWVKRLEKLNNTSYERINLETELGRTVVWALNREKKELKTIVIFPGFRTTSLFWDFDRALDPIRDQFRIFMVDTNGQPCLSDGNSPAIKSNGYGIWAKEVFNKLGIEKAVITGASFGGLVCMKLCMVAPELVEKAVMMNPGCLQAFSTSFKNLYYNILPILAPSTKNVKKFLDNAVFYKPHHALSPDAEKMILDFEVFALRHYKDKTQKPYEMKEDELGKVLSDVYLIEGDKDILFPYQCQ